MKHYRNYIILTAIVILVACSCKTSYENNQLLGNLYKYTDVKQDMLPGPVYFDGDDTNPVNTCDIFIKNIKTHNLLETEQNYIMFLHYIPCLSKTLTELSGDPVSPTGDSLSMIIYSQLDLSSFDSSFRRKIDSNSTFTMLGYELQGDDTRTLIYRPEWLYEFILIGRGDYNNDGNEDLQVVFIDKALQSTYYSSDLLVLSRSSEDNLWRNLDYRTLLD